MGKPAHKKGPGKGAPAGQTLRDTGPQAPHCGLCAGEAAGKLRAWASLKHGTVRGKSALLVEGKAHPSQHVGHPLVARKWKGREEQRARRRPPAYAGEMGTQQ
ncbi:hypothetical protein D623_10004909 [Myotis brandtii]|uniref:Uncharacterized protein n=1 Tax=Myotis brandtii TaxID=109478 RepID=S7QCL4_MYOBR|nr:hypothetical protein D623_10004909 [Myotis brandtii]